VLGLVSRASQAFEELLEHFSIVAQNINDFSRLVAVARELHAYERNAAETSSRESRQEPGIVLVSLEGSGGRAGEWLHVRHLTLLLPSGQPLIRDLSFSAPPLGGMLIAGPSGIGKTSLLRAIAGLWTNGSGSVARRLLPGEVLFLPQRPYIAPGSLRQQLLYPSGEMRRPTPRGDDAALVASLDRVGLGGVLARCGGSLDGERRWAEELSLGEQQRLGFARVLVHRPTYVLLDEATSACDQALEAELYRCVASTCAAWVSVGHRASLAPFHRVRLELLPGLASELLQMEGRALPER